MTGRVGILLRIFTFVCVVFGIALIVATWFFFMRPLTLDAACGDQPVILVGNSLGARVAFLIAIDRPSQVERIVALNGGPLRLVDPKVNMFPANRKEAQETMEGLMGPSAKSIPDTVLDDIVRRAKTGPAARLEATVDEIGAFFLDDRLGEVETPVDLIWGLADQLYPVEYAQRLKEGLPTARLTTLPDCGHVPQRECPVIMVEALLQVLDQGPPVSKVALSPDSDLEIQKSP